MDIYQESISFLGNGADFDENGLFQCELSSDTNNHDDALFLTVFKNEATINLHMSLTSPVELPTLFQKRLPSRLANMHLNLSVVVLVSV